MTPEASLLDALISGRLPSSVALIAVAVHVIVRVVPEMRAQGDRIIAKIDELGDELRDRRLSDVAEAVREATASEPDRGQPIRTRTGRQPALKEKERT